MIARVTKLLADAEILHYDPNGNPYTVGSVSARGVFRILLADDLEGVVRTDLESITVRISEEDMGDGERDDPIDLDVDEFAALRDVILALETVLPDDWQVAK